MSSKLSKEYFSFLHGVPIGIKTRNLHTADSISEDDEGGAASAPKKEPALSALSSAIVAAICFCLCGREEKLFCSHRNLGC